MSQATITGNSMMGEVLEAYPSAQRALFQRYHIGGCNSCGYELNDTLEAVARGHNILDLTEMLNFLDEAEQLDQRSHASPAEVATALASENPPRLLDVRTSDEWELARIEGATFMTQALATVMMRWSKETPIVFYCHVGQRSIDAASYFTGHGFTDVRSMTGGIDAWSLQVDSSVPRYELIPDSHDGTTLRTLRSVVSEAKGCGSTVAP